MKTKTEKKHLYILLRHFWKIDNMFLSEMFIMSDNKSRKESLVNRHNANYRLIKNYFINCAKQKRKALLDLYYIPMSIWKQLYKLTNACTLAELKTLFN